MAKAATKKKPAPPPRNPLAPPQTTVKTPPKIGAKPVEDASPPTTDRFEPFISLVARCKASKENMIAAFASVKQILNAGDWTAAQLAEVYGRLRDADAELQEGTKFLADMIGVLNNARIPEAFEAEKISSFTTQSGYRVTVAERLVASIIAEAKDSAFEWLRANGLEALIIETVNASSLSAAARHRIEEENLDLPEDKFKTTVIRQTSLTRIKK